ncbi:DUF4625 domain-containing protein [Pedobacter sp.]|uniref:DUF4625 domain-containing protein n=1 Tax=Pedobacter sp. TaxID=1411316 RepID=UPI00396CFC26
MFITSLLVFSCKKEVVSTEAEPVINIREIRVNNNKTAYTGQDLHIDAQINAQEKIKSIKLQITLAESGFGWSFLSTYTKSYEGLKKADFHEHINVPNDAKTGDYNLLIIVTDERGKRSEAKVNFKVIKDLNLPVINNIVLKTSSTNLNISGEINAPNKIERLEVELQSSAWTRELVYNDVDIKGFVSFMLNKNIDISSAPSGHYHLNITIIDQAEKQMSYHYHFDKN